MKMKPQFPELSITLRAGSHDEIYGILALALNGILLNQDKRIGSVCTDTYNFRWRFTNEDERKGS